MAYSAPLGDALEFTNTVGATYAVPNGDAVNFPVPDPGGVTIPFVRGVASGAVTLIGAARGLHSPPKWARFGQASGKVLVKGLCRGAHGVAGDGRGAVKPRSVPPTGARTVPHLNAKTGEVEIVTTNPPCFHV